MKPIAIYTDGSCDPLTGTGAWAAIVVSDDEKQVRSGKARNTTAQRMELTAALQEIHHLKSLLPEWRRCDLYDSQYLADLPAKK
jgi:ribonuclease HI